MVSVTVVCALVTASKDVGAKTKDYFYGFHMTASEKSVECLNSQIYVSPDNVELRMELALVLSQLNRQDEALKELDHVIAMQPRNAEAYLRRFPIYEEKKLLPEAVGDLNSALRLNGVGWVHGKRGRLLMQMGDYTGAIKDFDWCIRRHVSSSADAFAEVVPSYYQLRAECERKLGQTVKALSDYKAALKEDPNSEESRAAVAAYQTELRGASAK